MKEGHQGQKYTYKQLTISKAIKAVIFLRFLKFRWLAVCSSIDLSY